jgi:hypothetical protein
VDYSGKLKTKLILISFTIVHNFHRFPADEAGKNLQCKWKEFANIADQSDVSSFRICEAHFLETDFVEKCRNLKRLRLKKDSFPTVQSVFRGHSYLKKLKKFQESK